MRLSVFAFSCGIAAALAGPAAAQSGAKKPAAKAPSAQARTVNIVGTDDMKYSVTTITAKAGEMLTIRLASTGTLPKVAMAHNVVVLKIGTDAGKFTTAGAPHRATDFIPPAMASAVIAKTTLAGAGETVQVTFKVPEKPGTYEFICTFPGHFQSGMKGTLVVK